jgi:hypothetical protein
MCALAAAQVPPRTIEVRLQDPSGQVKSMLQASVRGSSGTQLHVRFRNDGQPPDLVALDTVHTAVFPMSDNAVTLTLSSAGKTWEVETTIQKGMANPVITLHLGPGGGLVVVQSEGDKSMDTSSTATASQGVSSWVWGGLFLGVGLGLGIGLRWIGRRPVRPALLSGLPERPGISPRSIPRGGLDALLTAELKEYRVIVVGEPGDSAGAHASCPLPAVSPVALVAAVEREAARAGGPVALLIIDAGRVTQDGRRPPLDDLNGRVGGRFPLWVVDGPEEWQG